MAEVGGEKRRSATVALAPVLAVSLLLDEIARALGALLVVEQIITWVLPFAKTHEPGTDLLASLALLAVAVVLIKVIGPKLPEGLKGVGYLAALVAGVIAVYGGVSYLKRRAADHPSSGLSASASSAAAGHKPAHSHAHVPRAATHHAAATHASSSASRHSTSRPASSSSSATSQSGSSGSVVSNSTSSDGASSQNTGAAAPSVTRTTAPEHRTQASPSVEVRSSKPSASAPAKGPAVEAESEREHVSGIEAASN